MQLTDILNKTGVPMAGVCGFDALRPLIPCRAAQRLPQGARSAVVCLFPYYVGEYEGRNISRYAIVNDYHTVVNLILQSACALLKSEHPNEEFVTFTDNSPVREVYAGWLAGLGFVGKNGQLITEEYGSYCFVGEIITTMELPAAVPLKSNCGGCDRCVTACPNGAVKAGGAIETSLCRSHITQKKGDLSAFEEQSIADGGFVWGCDICTDVCPHNKTPRLSPVSGFYGDIAHTLTEENCAELCKTHAFGWRGAKVPERNLAICRRGAKKA